MALEVDAYGPVVAKALTDVLAVGGLGTILALLREVDPSTNVAGRIRSYLTSPDRFRDLMAGGLVDDAALRVLVEEMGPAAVDPLLDVLGDSDSRAVRRSVFDSLVEMGSFAGLRAVERLADPRWFVVRNMLSLLQRMEHLPEDFDAQRFVEHEDPRVRREAFPLALRESLGRERVLALGLADPDERVVRMALLELQGDIPDGVLPSLVNRVVLSGERPAALRTLGVKALARSPSPLALSTLLALCTTRRRLFSRVRLANPTPEGLAALRALAAGWEGREEVKPVLAQAHRSKDVNIRRAVSGGMASEKPAPGGTP
jgi:hypothetical protein